LLVTERESIDFYNQVRTKRSRIMEQRSSTMSGSVEEEVDWTKYEPPEALSKLPNITSETIIAVVESSLQNIRNQIEAEKLRIQEQQTAIIEEAETEVAAAAARTEAAEGKGKGRASPDGLNIAHEGHVPQHPAALPTPRNSQEFLRPPLKLQKRTRFGGISRILRHVRGHSESSRLESSSHNMNNDPLHSRASGTDNDPCPTPFTQFIYKRLVKTPAPGVSASVEAQVECVSCLDDIPRKDAVGAICHHYCSRCFARLIETAIASQAQWPPKCCLNPVPFRTIAKYTSADLFASYRTKAEEFQIPIESRLYCPEPDCGVWIRQESCDPARRTATCERGHRMCTMCRGPAHPVGSGGRTCPQDMDTLLADRLAEEEGWRRCVRCSVLVEHTEACRHMTCRCGAQFCYVCGAAWHTCACSDVQLADVKRRAADRRWTRTAREEREAREMAEALRLVAEFERQEARKEEERREKARREREERRRREAEERARRKEARRRELDAKYEALRATLVKLEGLQKMVLEYGHDQEVEVQVSRAAAERAEMAAEQELGRKKGTAAAAAKVSESKAAFDREYADRVGWEKLLEDKYEEVLSLFWSDKIGGLPRVRDAMRAYRQQNDRRMDEWLAYKERELERLHYLVDDEMAIREELMETKKRRLDQRLENEQAGLSRKQRAEAKWFSLVVEERKRLLAEVETVERENDGEGSASDASPGSESIWASEDEFYDSLAYADA
jgi:hypothetical protein